MRSTSLMAALGMPGPHARLDGPNASLAALGLVSHAGGQGMLTLALGVLSAAFSSLVIFLEAFAAAFFGWLFFGETIRERIHASMTMLTGVPTSTLRKYASAMNRGMRMQPCEAG